MLINDDAFRRPNSLHVRNFPDNCGVDSGVSCTQCSPGFVLSEPVDSVGGFVRACRPCPAHVPPTISRSVAVLIRSVCPAGQFIDNGSCTTCAAGTYSGPDATSCSTCPVNTFSDAGSSSCSPCGIGQTSSPVCFCFAGRMHRISGSDSLHWIFRAPHRVHSIAPLVNLSIMNLVRYVQQGRTVDRTLPVVAAARRIRSLMLVRVHACPVRMGKPRHRYVFVLRVACIKYPHRNFFARREATAANSYAQPIRSSDLESANFVPLGWSASEIIPPAIHARITLSRMQASALPTVFNAHLVPRPHRHVPPSNPYCVH